MKKTNKKGFTIVELVIVIAVIAILAGVLIPTFSGVVEKANESKRLQACRNALTLALADQKDAELGKTYFVTDKYVYVYDANELKKSGADESMTKGEMKLGSSTEAASGYFMTKEAYVTGVDTYIVAGDYNQLNSDATANYEAVAEANLIKIDTNGAVK